MMKYFLSAIALSFLIACGGGTAEKKETTKTADITQDPNYQKGLELASKNQCFTCHAVDSRIQGPSYREVADKYAEYPDTIVSHLANKVITGGSGVWGEIMMTPHPNLSKSDAETLVRYVLLLKTKK
jgi:cytochrome c